MLTQYKADIVLPLLKLLRDVTLSSYHHWWSRHITFSAATQWLNGYELDVFATDDTQRLPAMVNSKPFTLTKHSKYAHCNSAVYYAHPSWAPSSPSCTPCCQTNVLQLSWITMMVQLGLAFKSETWFPMQWSAVLTMTLVLHNLHMAFQHQHVQHSGIQGFQHPVHRRNSCGNGEDESCKLSPSRLSKKMPVRVHQNMPFQSKKIIFYSEWLPKPLPSGPHLSPQSSLLDLPLHPQNSNQIYAYDPVPDSTTIGILDILHSGTSAFQLIDWLS